MTEQRPIITAARVPTAKGSRYLQQLCKHWGHKLDVTFDPGHGEVKFPNALCVMDAEPDVLVVRVKVEDPAESARMQDVVARHLDRFAFREAPLSFNWQPA